MIFGVGTHVVTTNRAATTQALRGLGVNSVRQEIHWNGVEQTIGTFIWGPAYQDRVECMREVGTINCSPLVYGNLARGIGQPYTQAERDQFLIYCRYMLPKLREAGCKYIEIWNEWNLAFGASASQLSSGIWGGASEYVALCRVVAPVIRELIPGAVVIGCAAAGHGKAWIGLCCDAGLLEYVDAVSCHPYCYGAVDPRPITALQDLDGLQIMLRTKNAGADVPVYITEMGWPTHNQADGTDAARVGVYLSQFYRGAKTRSWIKGVWWYDVIDGGTDATNKEFRFGLVGSDGITPKPAYHAYRAYIARDQREEWGWAEIATTATIETQINTRDAAIPDKILRGLRNLKSSGTTRVVEGVTLNEMRGPVLLSILDEISDQFGVNFRFVGGPVYKGATPEQTTVTKNTTWPNGW